MSRGVFFGLGDNAERLSGKTLLLKLDTPVFNLFSFGDKVLVQGFASLQMLSARDLIISTADFTWISNGDTNGIFYFIGQNFGRGTWSNPVSSRVTGSVSGTYAGTIADVTDRSAGQMITNNAVSSWLKWDFGASKLRITDYSLRGRLDNGGAASPRNWKLQGSNDNSNWTDLDEQIDNPIFSGQGIWTHLVVSNLTGSWRYVRLLQTGLNNEGDYYLTASEIEFYGTLRY